MPKARSSSVINVLVAGDTKQFRKSMRKAGGAIADFSKRAAQASVVAGAAAVAIGKQAVDLAVDFEESLSKAQQVFGDAAVGIENWSKTSATALGMSKAEYLDAASSFGVFGKAAGLSGDLLAEFSDELVTTAADVASFNNLSPDEALTKLQAGLRGSNEPLQSIGVLINAAGVEAKALEMGLADANGEISEGNKIMARQALILEQLGSMGALGDFNRTSSGLANQTRILKARFKNLGIELGRVLLPIAVKVAAMIGKLITFGEKLQAVYKAEGFAGLIKMILDAAASIRQRLFTALIDIAPKVGRAIKEVAPVVARAVVDMTKQQVKLLAKLGKLFVDWIKPRIKPMLKFLGKWAEKIGRFILDKLPFVAEKIGHFAAVFLEWVGPMLRKLLEKMPAITKAVVGFIATEVIPKVVEAAGKLAEKLVPALLGFAGEILAGLGSIGAQMASAFKDSVIDPIVDEAKALAGRIGNALVNFANFAGDGAKTLGKKIIDSLIDGLKSVGGFFADLGTTLAGAFLDAVKSVWNNTIAGPLNTGIRAAVDALDFALGPFINFGDVPDVIPHLAEGGIITRPTLAMIGEGNEPEAVIPLSKMSGMGTTTININMPAGTSGDDVVAALEDYVRRNGSIPLATNSLVRR